MTGAPPRPELDDVPLGRVLTGIAAARGPGPQDLAIAQVERILRDTGDDWDRRGHRVGVSRRPRPRRPGAGANAGPATRMPWCWPPGPNWRPTAGALAVWRVAAEARPADLTPWVGAPPALRILGRSSSELSRVWQEIRARDPWQREAHLQILGYLSPEEPGSQAAVQDFLDEAIAVMPLDAPTACLPLTAVVRQYHRERSSGGNEALGVSRYWSQPHTARLLDQSTAHWLKSVARATAAGPGNARLRPDPGGPERRCRSGLLRGRRAGDALAVELRGGPGGVLYRLLRSCRRACGSPAGRRRVRRGGPPFGPAPTPSADVSRAPRPRRCWSATWHGSSAPLRRPAARTSRRPGRRPGGRPRGCPRRYG